MNKNKLDDSTWHSDLVISTYLWKFLLTVFGCCFLNFLFFLCSVSQSELKETRLWKDFFFWIVFFYWQLNSLSRIVKIDVQSQVFLSYSFIHRNIPWEENIRSIWSSQTLDNKRVNTQWGKKNLKINVSTSLFSILKRQTKSWLRFKNTNWW